MNKNRLINLTPIILFLFAYTLMGANDFFGLEYFKTFFLVLFFPLFIAYLILEIKEKGSHKSFFYYKLSIILFCILFTTGVATFILIKSGQGKDGYLYIHDGAIQTELATKKLLAGKNFYTEDFSDTVLAHWNEDSNPTYFLGERVDNSIVVQHYAYLPVYPILSIPFYLVTKNIFHFYDERLVFYVAFLGALWLLYKLVKGREEKLLALTLFGFNPFFVKDLVEGKNDILILFFLLLIVYLLQKKKIVSASIILGVAVMAKQTIWPLLPFYFFYLFFQQKDWRESVFYIWQKTKWGIFVGLLILLPFIFWDARSFWQDIYQYMNGSLATSYPINGFGWSRLIYRLGLVDSIHDYYPFYIGQIIFCLPLLWWLIKKQAKNNTVSFMLLGYMALLFTFWFFSRFFQSNYIVFLYQLLVITYFISYNEATNEAA